MENEQRRLMEELLFSGETVPSFAKKLFFGQCHKASLAPYPLMLPEERQALGLLLEALQKFAEGHIDASHIDQNGDIPRHVIEGLASLGILGMTIPKIWGGLGMSQASYCEVTEALARQCSSTALFVNAHQSIGLKALLLYGTEEQKQQWLEPLARGHKLAAFALTEPNAGSDASNIETKVIWDSSQNGYLLNGRKQWITNGGIADVLTVMAKTPIETAQGTIEKISAFLVTPDMPGFKVTAERLDKVGMRGTATSNLEFHNVLVPASNLLGPLGGGLKVCLTVLDYGRTTFGASCTGCAKMARKLAICHARSRYQFHRPLAFFGMVQQKIATMSTLIFAMEATTYLTAGIIDSHLSDFMLEAAILKVFASEALWQIIYDAMQIFGGRSFFSDNPLQRLMRDARLNMIGEGANEVLRVFIGLVGCREVGVAMQKWKGDLYFPSKWLKIIQEAFTKLFLPDMPFTAITLQKPSKHLAHAIRYFGFCVTRALIAYREKISEEQLLLNRLATGAIALYTCSASLSRLDQMLLLAGEHSPPTLEREQLACLLYCKQSLNRFYKVLNPLFRPEEKLIAATSQAWVKWRL